MTERPDMPTSTTPEGPRQKIGALKWQQAVINNRPQLEGIQCDEYRIGRFNGGEKYGAWFERESLGYFLTASEAKQACAAHMQKLSVVDRDEHNRPAVPADDVLST